MSEAPASASTRAVQDTAKLLGARLASTAFSVFFSAWLIRLLPADELVVWPIALALGGAIEALSSLGMGDTLVRRIPRQLALGEDEDAAALLKTSIGLNIVACGVFTLVLYMQSSWTAENLLRDADKASLVGGVALAALFLALQGRLSWALKATQQFGKMALLGLLTATVRTPLAVLLYSSMGIVGVVTAFTVVPAIACVLSIVWLWRYLWTSRRFESPVGLVRFALPFYGVSLTGFLRGRASYLVVGLLTTPEILAIYFVASKVSDYIREIGRFAISVVTPKLSEIGGAEPEARSAVFRTCTRYLFLGLLPLHLGVAVLARPLVSLYAGSEYIAAGTILAVLCLYAFLEALYDLHRAHVQVFAPPRHLLGLQVFSVAIDLGLMVALIAPYGALGAALAKATTYTILVLAGAWTLSRTMSVRYDTVALKWALIAVAAMSVGVVALSEALGGGAIAVMVAVAAGAALYVLVLGGRLMTRDIDMVIDALPGSVRDSVPGTACAAFIKGWLVDGRLCRAAPRMEDTVA